MQSKKLSTFKTVLIVFLVSVCVFGIMNMAARTPGIGYTAKCEQMAPPEVFSFGRTHTFGYQELVYLNISYNPIFFPISYLSGSGSFSGLTIVLHYPEEKVETIAALMRVQEEIGRNLVYLITISFLIGIIIEETAFHLKSKFSKASQ
ncbi:MAG: hypothetical protein QXL57_02645 [Candidatus Bathyarchaeia archaeon]